MGITKNISISERGAGQYYGQIVDMIENAPRGASQLVVDALIGMLINNNAAPTLEISAGDEHSIEMIAQRVVSLLAETNFQPGSGGGATDQVFDTWEKSLTDIIAQHARNPTGEEN
jgi:hypothetical protein